MGAAQRARPDLCRAAAERLAHRRRRMVAAGLSRSAADFVRRRAGARHGAQDRRHADRQPARPRDHRAHRQSAADRMDPARHQFCHRLRAGHARSGAADPPCRRLRAARGGGAHRRRDHRAVSERHRDPGARGAGGGGGDCRADRQRGPRHRLGDAGRRGARARRRDRRRSSPARLRLGAAEGARRDAGLCRRHVSGRAPAARAGHGVGRRRHRHARRLGARHRTDACRAGLSCRGRCC